MHSIIGKPAYQQNDMNDHHPTCGDANVALAFQEQRIPEIIPCLQQCFQKFKRTLLGHPMTEETREDIFWHSLFALDKRSKRKPIALTTAPCAYFRGFVLNFKRAYLSGRGRLPVSYSGEMPNDLPEDGDMEPSLTALLEREKMAALKRCIAKLDERSRAIVQGFYEGKKDDEIAALLGIANRRSIAVMRRRTFDKLGACLKKNYPGLF